MNNASAHTSEQFADAMIDGWIAGLVAKFASPNILVDTDIIVKKHYMLRYSDEIGDVDFVIMKTNGSVPLIELLPKYGYVIRPVSFQHTIVPGLFGEMKRSCFGTHTTKKLEKFVKFYDNLLKNPQFANRTFHRKVTGTRGHVAANVDHRLLSMMDDITVPLVFCFHGTDCATAWNTLLTTIKGSIGGDGTVSTIRGHQVVLIYCMSDVMITWETRLTEEQKLETSERAIIAA
jgi:hypothetical protein